MRPEGWRREKRKREGWRWERETVGGEEERAVQPFLFFFFLALFSHSVFSCICIVSYYLLYFEIIEYNQPFVSSIPITTIITIILQGGWQPSCSGKSSLPLYR